MTVSHFLFMFNNFSIASLLASMESSNKFVSNKSLPANKCWDAVSSSLKEKLDFLTIRAMHCFTASYLQVIYSNFLLKLTSPVSDTSPNLDIDHVLVVEDIGGGKGDIVAIIQELLDKC